MTECGVWQSRRAFRRPLLQRSAACPNAWREKMGGRPRLRGDDVSESGASTKSVKRQGTEGLSQCM
ncbi:hypothetical protein HMPREF9120_01966 [Neisseria sp. oral taxon 020 str. F0370]|nr:hypothetical protein HMPREF9120_01966 [Neisseria sp. oral taxon 020 str. F0370]